MALSLHEKTTEAWMKYKTDKVAYSDHVKARQPKKELSRLTRSLCSKGYIWDDVSI